MEFLSNDSLSTITLTGNGGVCTAHVVNHAVVSFGVLRLEYRLVTTLQLLESRQLEFSFNCIKDDEVFNSQQSCKCLNCNNYLAQQKFVMNTMVTLPFSPFVFLVTSCMLSAIFSHLYHVCV